MKKQAILLISVLTLSIAACKGNSGQTGGAVSDSGQAGTSGAADSTGQSKPIGAAASSNGSSETGGGMTTDTAKKDSLKP